MSEPLRFDGDVVIITGAGRGIGRCHALELARRGARVVVNDPGAAVDGDGTDAAPADRVTEEIRAHGGEAVADHSSVATPEGGEAIVRHALDHFGALHAVINNAGILRDKSFPNLTPETVDAVLTVHLRGAFWVTVPAWRHFRQQRYGRVVTTTSGTGLYGNFGQANYGAAKAGLVGLIRTLAVEGQSRGILANAVSPMASTRMTRDLLGDAGELLDPEQISPAVAFLAHRSCELTGQVLSVGGGHISAVLTAVTRGVTERTLTAEVVRDRLAEILDPAGAAYPANGPEEIQFFMQQIQALGEA